VSAQVDQYLTHLRYERRLAGHTLESYARDLTGLAAFAAGEQRAIDELTRRDLEAFVRTLMSEGKSPRSVARWWRASVASIGFSPSISTSASPAVDLSAPRAWKVLPKFLSSEDVERLLNAPDTATPRGLRDRALIELLYATGLRVSELVALRPAGPASGRRLSDDDGEGAEAADRADGRRGGEVGNALPSRGAPGLLGKRTVAASCSSTRAAAGRAHAGGILEDSERLRKDDWDQPRRSARTCCGIRSRRTCSSAGPTCGRSR
jgi:hypothetical protein